MFKQHKRKIGISSLIILIPMLAGVLIWDRLPATMAIHWGADGAADGFGSKAFVVFGFPAMMLLLHWIAIFFTLRDKRQKNQSRKALNLVFWIIPLVTLMVMGSMYSILLRKTFNADSVIPLILGLLFIITGNYMPKMKQNSTLGIRIPWTLANQENWNRTHRFSGKLWVIGGLLILFSMALPSTLMTTSFVVILMILGFAPLIYSYGLYRKHKKAGIAYTVSPKSKGAKIASWIGGVLVVAIVIAVIVLMFTGKVDVELSATKLAIDASFIEDFELPYSAIDTVQIRDDVDTGARIYGIASVRLSLGTYQNEEFGQYKRYTYVGNDTCIVVDSAGKILVFNEKTPVKTEALYRELLAKIGK